VVLRRALKPTGIVVEKDLERAMNRARKMNHLDLVTLDLMLPGYSKLEVLKKFRENFPELTIVVVSAIDSADVIRAALAAGAKGYIPKTSSATLMQIAFRIVATGSTYVPPQALQTSTAGNAELADFSALPLSGRQVEVLKRIARGLANRQIADELEISENTVKHHTHEVFRALGVSSRTEALVAAMRHGIRFDRPADQREA